VVCLGDSTTQGYFRDADTYPRLLESALRSRSPGRPVEVLNAGVQGYTTAESLINFELRFLPYRPDVVIVCHGRNDLKASLAPGFQPDYSHWRHHLLPPQPVFFDHLPAWFDLSATYVLFREAALRREELSRWQQSQLTTLSDFQSDFAGLATFRRNLRSIVSVARGEGVEPVLMTFYFQPSVETPEIRVAARGIELQNDIVRSLGKELGVTVVDVARELEADPALTFDDIHFTPEGNRRRVEILLRRLAESGIIPRGAQ